MDMHTLCHRVHSPLSYFCLFHNLLQDLLEQLLILVDKEEIGSVGATGMQSRFFENMVAEVMDRCGNYSELGLRRALANSYMLSSDVSAISDGYAHTLSSCP